ALGLAYIAPLLFVTGLVSLIWAGLFARMRDRPVDPGWAMAAWLYVLLLPADLSPLLAGLGMSFAAVLGLHIFGGTGRYIAPPAALGALFIQFSYPGTGQLSSAASWQATAATEPGMAGIPLALACLFGAGLLMRTGAVSLRTILGGVLGIALAGMLAGLIGDAPIAQIAWHRHLVLGSLPVCLAFVVTDPTTLPLTRAARWIHGLLFGLLVVAIRVLDPTHPDGSLVAVLLAILLVPLIDHFVLRRHIARVGGRLELRR
ncbi:MAG: RnfABCDGE type electron transport complex subunit D, partial [Woeseiaceae bacterium]